MTPILAIDPGASGGIAYRSPEGEVRAYAMPDTPGEISDLLTSLVAESPDVHAYMEKVGGYAGGKGQPGGAMFNFGYGVGYIHAVLHTRGTPLRIVTPQTWIAALHLGTRGGSDYKARSAWKKKLKAEAERRYPALKVTLSTADALLLLSYAVETGLQDSH